MDLRFTLIGSILIGIGIVISLTYINISNTGPIEGFLQARMVAQLGGIISGLGVLILLVSFGLYRRRLRFKKK